MESNKTAYTYLAATVAFALCFFAMCEAPAIISLSSSELRCLNGAKG